MEQTRNQQQKKNWKFHKHVEINTILSDKWVTEEIKGKISNILRPKKKKKEWKTTNQKLWDATKSILRGKFTVVNTYIKNEETA